MSSTAVALLEQNVSALQNALVVAMEEVDQLRSQVFAETGKLQREFRDTVDTVVRSANSMGTPGSASAGGASRLFESPRRMLENADVAPRLEYLELAVRALQERRDATPVAIDTLTQQMRRWSDAADSSARQLELKVMDAVASAEQKLKNNIDERLREVEASAKRTTLPRVEALETALREQDKKLQAMTTLIGSMDKRLHAAEEGLVQLDAEQHEVTGALQGIRDQQRRRPLSPTRRNDDGGSFAEERMESLVTEHSAILRDEVLNAVDAKIHRRLSPPATAAPQTVSLEQRATHQEIQALRQDITRCVGQIERLMDEHQRLSQQHHTCIQTVQRVEHNMDGLRDRLDLDLKTELQRFDTLQKTFFSRQEQVLNSERHQLGVKISSDLQRMHQRQMEELQKSELRRLDDIRAAQNTLRDEFTAFSERQRDEQVSTVTSVEERVRKATEELKTFVAQEVAQQTDAAKRGTVNANDELRKVASKTMEELKRVKQLMEEQNTRTNDQSKFLHARVQQILDAEVHRFDQIAFEFSAKLQKQVDEEVHRVVTTHENTLARDVDSQKEMTTREIRNLREELGSLRSSLQSIAAPSNALGSLDNRVDVLRRDVLDLHESVARVHELESRIQSNVSQDTRVSMEAIKSDILRDVSQHIVRFDQALVELAQENASLRSKLTNSEAENMYLINNASSSATAAAAPIRHAQQTSSRGLSPSATAAGGFHSFRVPSGGGSGSNTPVSFQHSSGLDERPRGGVDAFLQPITSVFGRDASAGSSSRNVYPTSAHSDLVSSTQRPSSAGGGNWASSTPAGGATHGSSSNPNHHSSVVNNTVFSRVESPDRYHHHQNPLPTSARDDPLIGVFSEYQSP